MKKLLTTAMALSIAASGGAAFAQPHGDHHRDKAERKYERDIRKAERKYDREVRKAHKRYHAAAYHRPPGYVYRDWRRGQYLPAAYRVERYRIVDYRYYDLPPPPRGYYYTRVDNDVLLTAAATGLIASVIVDLFQ